MASLDQLHRWDLSATFGEQRVLENWEFMTERWNDDLRDFWAIYAVTPDDLVLAMESEVERLVREYPDVRFDLLLVPSTLYDYANDLQVGADRLDKRLFLRDQTAHLAARWPNAYAWDFQGDGWMVNDLSHYKDMDHFGQGIIAELLARLADESAVTAPEEILAETPRLRDRITVFLERFCAQDPTRCQDALLRNLASSRR